MARENINVGAAPNDGLGDPIRTAYIKTNNNFIELYARAQTSPPATLIGTAGDVAGMYAYDSNDFYWCFQNYDGSSIIWAVLNTSGNVTVTNISSGTSNVNIAAVSGPVTVGVGGVSNVAVFTTTGSNLKGTLTTIGNITAPYFLGNGSQLTGLPATYGNADVAAYLPTYTGNLSPAVVAASGNLSAANFSTSGLISVTGNANVGNLGTSGLIVATGNVTGGNITTAGVVTATGNVTGGNITTAGVVTATGNVTGGNLVTGGVVAATGNVTGGNITTVGEINATGNITTSGFFIGTFQGNITGNLTVPGLNTQVLYNNAGNAGADSGFTYSGGIVTVTGNVSSGNLVTGGKLSVTGNANVGNLGTSGLIVATGNVTGGNLVTGGVVTATGNANVGNLGTSGLIVATGNVTGGNLVTAGVVTAGGNVSGSYFLGNGSQLTNVTTSVLQNGTSNVAIAAANDYVRIKVGGVANVAVFTETEAFFSGEIDVTGNANVGNLGSAGVLVATGNVTGGNLVTAGNISGSYFLGNGSQLTGITTTTTAIQNGTANVRTFLNANVTVSAAGTANVLVVTGTGANIAGTLDVTGNANTGNLGTTNVVATNLTGTLQTATQTNITSVGTLGSLSVTGNVSTGNVSGTTGTFTNVAGTLTTAAQPNITSVGTLGSLSVTGNVSTGNVSGTTGTFTNVAGTLTTAAQTNITSVGTLGSLAVTGNITGGNLSVSTGTITGGNIVNSNANGVGNIGTASTYFDTVFAKATSAQYADLAEMYEADADYAPGTVVKFGGKKEITICDQTADTEVAGIVSTNPAYLMNSGLVAQHTVAVALVGRVPCQVQGPVRRGQLMVSAGNGRAKASSNPAPGTMIGKALQSFDGEHGVIEVVVGRL